MIQQTLDGVAETYGLVIEATPGVPGNEPLFRIFKGAKRVFTGNEQEVRSFLKRYEAERPALFAESTHAYRD